MMPYPFKPYCPDETLGCIVSPAAAIDVLNRGGKGLGWVTPGIELRLEKGVGVDIGRVRDRGRRKDQV